MTKLHYVHGSENHFFLLDVDELKDPLDDTQFSHLAQKLAQSDVLPYLSLIHISEPTRPY